MKMDVIILAGGLGTRLRSVIQDIPKPMAVVNGKPFLQIILESLDLERVNSIILSVGYKAEVVQEYFKDSFHNIPIQYAVEKEPLGTGGGIALAMQKASSEQVLIVNGDTFFEVDVDSMFKHHINVKSDLTVALKDMQDPYRYGAVETEENARVTAFKEKDPELKQAMINGGVYILNRSLQVHFPKDHKWSFERDFLEANLQELHFSSIVSNGLFIDIGIPEDYDKAQNIFK